MWTTHVTHVSLGGCSSCPGACKGSRRVNTKLHCAFFVFSNLNENLRFGAHRAPGKPCKISGTSKGASPFKLSGKLNESLVEVDAKSVHSLPSKGRRISVFMTLLGYI